MPKSWFDIGARILGIGVALALATALWAGSTDEDSLIQKINAWELEGLKSPAAVAEIEAIFQSTSRHSHPRVWLHAYTFLPETERTGVSLPWDEFFKAVEAQKDKPLLMRASLFRIRKQANEGAGREDLQASFAAGDVICQTWRDPF